VKHAIRSHWRDFVAVVGLVAVATVIAVIILTEQGLRFPLVEESPKLVKVELQDAQAVQPGAGQSVRVAGVEIGKIGDVEVEDGVAVVELEIDHEHADLVREDASALLRPKTALKDMFLEVSPGNGEVLAEGERIPVENTAPDVDPDEILASLDSDTRPYLKLLVSGAGKGLRGRGEDLRATLRRLEPLHRDLARVTRATAARRRALKRLVHNYSLLVGELGRRPANLERLVSASSEVFDALGGQEQEISTAVARLPGTLRRSAATLGEVKAFAGELRPTLAALRPPIGKLDATNRAIRPFLDETTPILRDEIRPFVRAARPWTSDLRVAVNDAARAAPDLKRSLGGLNRFFNIGAYNPGGAEGLAGLSVPQQRARSEGLLYWLAWTAQNGVSLFNTADAQGVWRRVTICGIGEDVITALLLVTMTRLQTEAPELLDFITGGAGVGTGAPGSPVDELLQSGFGTCNFNALPTAP
jgi:phospholipid/cholesterol/gamma-HCH transport system substrate-binding protein